MSYPLFAVIENATGIDVPYKGNYGYPEYNLIVGRVRERKTDFLIDYDTLTGLEKWRYADLREYKALLSGEIKTESVRKILALVGETQWVLLCAGRIVGLDPAIGECKKNIEIDNVDLTHFENAETEFRSAAGYNDWHSWCI